MSKAYLKDPVSFRKELGGRLQTDSEGLRVLADAGLSLPTSIILRSMYAIQPKGVDDPFITVPAEAAIGFSAGATPGKFLIDIFPSLKHIPDWMPGTAWKRFGKYYRARNIESRVRPYEHVRDQMVRSSHHLIRGQSCSYTDRTLLRRKASLLLVFSAA